MSLVLIGDGSLLLLIRGDTSRAGNSQAYLGDSRIWIVSPSLQIRVWNLADNRWSLSFLVKLEFCVSNYDCINCFCIDWCQQVFFAQMTSYDIITSDIICILMLPIIPSQSILNVWRLVGLTALITVTLCMTRKEMKVLKNWRGVWNKALSDFWCNLKFS